MLSRLSFEAGFLRRWLLRTAKALEGDVLVYGTGNELVFACARREVRFVLSKKSAFGLSFLFRT
jgi:hypothetical protein